MVSPSIVDEVTLWLSSAILSGSKHETDRMVVERMAIEARDRPLSEIVSEISGRHREDAGEFGLGQEAFLLASVIVPAVHGLVSSFAAKFFEGAASQSGKAIVDTLKERLAKSLTGGSGKAVSEETLTDLETRLARRAKELDQPASSYEDVVRQLRNNPKILL